MLNEEFIIEILEDSIKRIVAANLKPRPEIWAKELYNDLAKEADIYVLTKDYIGKLT
ncbi:MAG: hypothetical protein ACFFDY_01150 [Candidatus Thorarchaeota archaeon]